MDNKTLNVSLETLHKWKYDIENLTVEGGDSVSILDELIEDINRRISSKQTKNDD